MKHEDFLKQYFAIREKEVKALNEALANLPEKEYHFEADFPFVSVGFNNCEGWQDAKIMAVRYPVTRDGGILVMPEEDIDTYEVGWSNLHFSDIDYILDNLPE